MEGAKIKKHKTNPPHRQSLLMVKMPLPWSPNALKGITPLSRANNLRELLIKRVIIEISVETDCVSLLSHMCHRGVCTLQKAFPEARVQ